MPLQSFATLFGIPFASENSSLVHLLVTFLFATAASHYSSLWLGDEPVHRNLSPPVPIPGGQAPSLQQTFLFASKAHGAGTPYRQILSRFCTLGSFTSFCATVLLAMLPSPPPVPNFTSTHTLCWSHWLNTVPRTHPWRSSLPWAHPCQPTGVCPSPPSPPPPPLAVLGVKVEVPLPPPATAGRYITHPTTDGMAG